MLSAEHKQLLATRPDLTAKMQAGKLGCCDWSRIINALQAALNDAPQVISILETIINAVEPMVTAA